MTEIDQRISEIAGDNSTQQVSAVVETYNNMAAHGAVPHDLHELDVDYWLMVTNTSICSYADNCEPEEIQKRHIAASTQSTILPTLYDMVNFLIQEALAYTPQPATVYAKASPLSCTCYISDSTGGMTPLSVSATSIDDNHPHGDGHYLKVYGSIYGIAGSNVSILLNAEVADNNYYHVASGTNYLTTSKTFTVSGNPTSTWIYNIAGTGNAWTG